MIVCTLTTTANQTGNALFMWSYAYLLSRALGYQAELNGVHGFKNTFNDINGICAQGTVIEIRDSGEQIWTEDFDVTVARIKECQAIVLVHGHMEQSRYYIPHRDALRYILKPDVQYPDSNEVALHIRGQDVKGQPQRHMPRDYYTRALDITGRENAVIYTDDVDASAEYDLGLPIKSGEPLDDFAHIMAARAIVINKSTFSWWAAFLSNASQIVQPEPVSTWRCKDNISVYLGVPEWTKLEIP